MQRRKVGKEFGVKRTAWAKAEKQVNKRSIQRLMCGLV